MNIQDTRRAVLRALIKQRHGDVARQFAMAVKKPDGQINDMLSDPPRKSFGERIARSLEQNYQPTPLPIGYFDDPKNAAEQPNHPHVSEPNNAQIIYGSVGRCISEVISLMSELDEHEQREVVGAVKVLYSQTIAKRQNSKKRAGS